MISNYSINLVFMTGIVEYQPYYSETKNKGKDQKYASFTLQVPRNYNKNKFDHIKIKSFGNTASYINENIQEGMELEIRGVLKNNNYTNKDGVKIYGLCVQVTKEDIHILTINEPIHKKDDDVPVVVIPEDILDETEDIFK